MGWKMSSLFFPDGIIFVDHELLVLAISELKVPEKKPPKRQAVKETEWNEWNEWSEWHEWVESKPEKKQEKKTFKDCMHSESVIC